MKAITEKDLKVKIKAFFKSNPKETKVYATNDGSCFFHTLSGKNYATMHAKAHTLEVNAYSKSGEKITD